MTENKKILIAEDDSMAHVDIRTLTRRGVGSGRPEIISFPEPTMNVEINGVKYEPRQQPKMPKQLTALVLAAGMTAISSGAGLYPKQMSLDVNIVEEYKLILQKKSRLSRRERDWVEAKFHDTYRQVSDYSKNEE